MKTITDRIIEQNDIKTELSIVLHENNVIVPNLFKEYPDSFNLIIDSYKNNTTLIVDIPSDNYEFTLNNAVLNSKNFLKYRINWGDETAQETSAMSSIVHTYEKSGRYVIKIPDQISTCILNRDTSDNPGGYTKDTFLKDSLQCTSCIIGIRFSDTILKWYKNLLPGCFARCGISSLDYLSSFSNLSTNAAGYGQFFECGNIKEIVTTRYSNISSTLMHGNGVFKNCKSLSSLYAPKLSTLAAGAFLNCKNLVKAYAPDLTSVQGFCFDNCRICEISCEHVTTTGMRAFSNNRALSSVYLPVLTGCNNTNGAVFSGCNGISTFYMPKLMNAAYNMFNGCNSVTSLDFPELTSVGTQSFVNCSKLQHINLGKLASVSPNNNPYSGFFSGCDCLSNVEISKDNENYYCLTKDNLISNAGCVLIDRRKNEVSWGSAVGAISVCLPTEISSFGNKAITGLKTNNIKMLSGDGIIILKDSALHSCKSIEHVYFKNAEQFYDGSFGYCRGLKTLDISNVDSPPTLQSTMVFDNLLNNQVVSVYIKHGTTDAYMNASTWKAMVKSESGRIVLIEKDL